jgi:hypothetical protein
VGDGGGKELETGAERHVSVDVRGLATLPLVVQARAAA